MSEQAQFFAYSTGLDVQEFARLRQLVDDRLALIFDEGKERSRLVCAMRHGLLSPGKRLRPVITLLACQQSGGDLEAALDGACAVELVHAASLVMDDLPSMDNAQLRRGAVATHRVFGEGTTMLAAVAMLNEAYRLLSNMEKLSPERRLRTIGYLTSSIGIDGLTGGQERDIMCGGDGTHSGLTMAEIEKRHAEKTGALFVAAAAIGGEAAKADDRVIEGLRCFGAKLGLAYQAFDDMIDIMADPEKSGKDTGQDAGKSTVVSIAGREGAQRNAERWLKEAIEAAEGATDLHPAPLACLAETIARKFLTLTN